MVRRSLNRRSTRGGSAAKAEAEEVVRSVFTEASKAFVENTATAKNEAEMALKKFKEHCEDISDLITDETDIYLWVIDMQHDFIDDDFEDQTVLTTKDIEPTKDGDIPIKPLNQTIKIRIVDGIKKVEQRLNNAWDKLGKDDILPEDREQHIHKGRFAVDEGLQCIKDIGHYINLLNKKTDSTNKSKLKQIIFSRDVHTSSDEIINDKIDKPNHCSFSTSDSDEKGKIDGIGFPAHCVNGTVGCQLHDEIWKMVKEHGEKSMVVIKGCKHNVDSFGAVPYSCKRDAKRYTESRQHNGCNTECRDKSDLPETGSYVLEKKPEGEDNRNDKLISNLEDIKKDDNKDENILKSDLNNSTKDVLHLVCGLAGDYCVRDTAINLKFKYPSHRVAVIADATRYPSLPDYVIGAKPKELIDNLHLNSHKDVDGEHFFLTAPDTLLYTYSPKFFSKAGGVLFTMDKNRTIPKEYGEIKYSKPPGIDEETRSIPERDTNNKYWCLSRHMYLLGKQLELCEQNKIGCFKTQRLGMRRVNNLSVLGLSSHLSPTISSSQKKKPGGKRRRTRHRKGRRSKKGVARKARNKTRRRRRRKGKKSKKH